MRGAPRILASPSFAKSRSSRKTRVASAAAAALLAIAFALVGLTRAGGAPRDSRDVRGGVADHPDGHRHVGEPRRPSTRTSACGRPTASSTSCCRTASPCAGGSRSRRRRSRTSTSRRRASRTSAPARRSARGTTAAGRSSSTAPTPPAALPIITAWWAANGNQPNVHEALAGFNANVNVTLRSAPRIANEAINAGISIAYYNAAGIPDLNGNPWSTTSPNILDEAEIAAGGLFAQGSHLPAAQVRHLRHAAQQRLRLLAHRPDEPRHEDVLPARHVRAAGRRLDCPVPLDPEQREQHRRPDAERQPRRQEPVQDVARRGPAGWVPDHQRLPRHRQHRRDLRRSTRPRPTCRPRRWRPSTTPQALPGGSVQTWPSPGTPGAPTYWPNTERVGFFDTPAVDHDNIIAGTYHGRHRARGS